MENGLENQTDRENDPQEHAFYLYELSPEKEEELKEQIEKSGGVVRVFVHPLRSEIPKSERVLKIWSKLLQSKGPVPPLILFEETQITDAVKDWINDPPSDEGQIIIRNDVFIVPTLPRWPYPVIQGEDMPEDMLHPTRQIRLSELSDESHLYMYKGFYVFIEVLKNLGVKKILVGGILLEFNENGDIDQCVGRFIEEIKMISDIDVQLSNAVAPRSRQEVLKKPKYKDLK